MLCLMSHPVWVRGLKQGNGKFDFEVRESHPVWVRGLKPARYAQGRGTQQSHPVWVRGLKPNIRLLRYVW